MALTYSTRFSRARDDPPRVGIRSGHAVESRLERGREGIDGGRRRSRPTLGRHLPGPQLAHDLLEDIGAAGHVPDIEPVEHEAAGLQPFVVAGDAVAVEDLPREGLRRLSRRPCNRHDPNESHGAQQPRHEHGRQPRGPRSGSRSYVVRARSISPTVPTNRRIAMTGRIRMDGSRAPAYSGHAVRNRCRNRHARARRQDDERQHVSIRRFVGRRGGGSRGGASLGCAGRACRGGGVRAGCRGCQRSDRRGRRRQRALGGRLDGADVGGALGRPRHGRSAARSGRRRQRGRRSRR